MGQLVVPFLEAVAVGYIHIGDGAASPNLCARKIGPIESCPRVRVWICSSTRATDVYLGGIASGGSCHRGSSLAEPALTAGGRVVQRSVCPGPFKGATPMAACRGRSSRFSHSHHGRAESAVEDALRSKEFDPLSAGGRQRSHRQHRMHEPPRRTAHWPQGHGMRCSQRCPPQYDNG